MKGTDCGFFITVGLTFWNCYACTNVTSLAFYFLLLRHELYLHILPRKISKGWVTRNCSVEMFRCNLFQKNNKLRNYINLTSKCYNLSSPSSRHTWSRFFATSEISASILKVPSFHAVPDAVFQVGNETWNLFVHSYFQHSP